jgi:hypothetical protein
MGQSERIAYRNRRVASYSQYPLLDDADLGGFQSGLRFKNGKAKKGVYNAFAHTIYVRRVSRRGVEVFACERGADGIARFTIEGRNGKKGKWKTLATGVPAGFGYFDRKVKSLGPKSQYRFRVGSATSRAAGVSRH